MKTSRCPICKKKLGKRVESFPFCSARCKLVDAGNWFEGSYRIADAHEGPNSGEN